MLGCSELSLGRSQICYRIRSIFAHRYTVFNLLQVGGKISSEIINYYVEQI